MAEDLLSWAYFPPNTSFKLTNVPWDMSYRDIVKFADTGKQQAYFNGLTGTTVSNATAFRMGGASFRLNIPFNEAQQYNYVVVYNDYADVETPRYYYYFIQTVQMVNLYTTQFNVMLDVVQSFEMDVTLGRCYVERGHIGIANSKQFDDHGRSYLTLSEGLDTGAETAIVSQEFSSLFDQTGTYGVIMITTIDLSADLGDDSNPHNPAATGTDFEGLPNGVQFIYFQTTAQFTAFMAGLSAKSWAAQGIVSIYAIPQSMVAASDQGSSVTMGSGTGFVLKNGKAKRTTQQYYKENFRNSFTLPSRYRNLRKFLTYPYASIELTCLNGKSIILKPELIPEDYMSVMELHELVLPGARIRYYAPEYNANGASRLTPASRPSNGVDIDSGEFIDAAVGIDDLPQFAAVNNTAAAIVASSIHSLNWSKQSASWAQSKTQMGVNNAYAQAGLSTAYASEQTAAANNNRNANTTIGNNSATRATAIAQTQANFDYGQQVQSQAFNGAGSLISSAAGGASEGGVAGAAAGAAGSAAGTAFAMYQGNQSYNQANRTRADTLANSIDTANQTTAQANGYANQTTGIGNRQTQQYADMNRTLGTAVAKGDYANTIAGINAKIQDMQDTPPSQVGSIGGDAFNVSNGFWGLLVRYRQIQPYAMRQIGEFWLRYGYYVQAFLTPPPSWQVMSRFTFWKMHELYVRSSTCPEEFRMTIKGIFEKGVTVWNDPNDIGAIDYADNDPLSGVSY